MRQAVVLLILSLAGLQATAADDADPEGLFPVDEETGQFTFQEVVILLA